MPTIQPPEAEDWIKSFHELKKFQEINKRIPNEGDNILLNVIPNEGDNILLRSTSTHFRKCPKMEKLLKWMTIQRHEYKRYLEGEETALSESRVYLLRSIGMLDDMNEIKTVTNERRCIVGGCRRVANESLYCTEHRGAYKSVTDQTQHNKPTEYKSSKSSHAKRQKLNYTGELHTKVAQHTLKSPPELECRAMATLVELVAETVAKEVRYLALESSTEKAELAIKRFAMEIYYPMLYTSFKEQGMETSYSAIRVLISTLLAIREMLIINAERFFPFETTKDSSTQKESDEEATSSKIISRDIASAVVQNSAKALQRKSPDIFLKLKFSNQDNLFDQYLEASKSYDSKGEEFQFALGWVDARVVYQTAKGSQLGERESIMARAGFNYAREQHPLIQHNDGTSTGLRRDSQPVPNVCFFVMGGDETKSEKNEISKSISNVEESHDVMKDERVTKIYELKRRYEGVSKHNR